MKSNIKINDESEFESENIEKINSIKEENNIKIEKNNEKVFLFFF